MSERIPCPACGSEHGPETTECRVCGFLAADRRVRAGPERKCARCGGLLGAEFEFCQVCGLQVQTRHPRPRTMELELTPPPDSGLWATRQAAEPDSVTAEWSPTPPSHHSSITFVPPDDDDNNARPQTPVGGLPVVAGRDSMHIPQKIVASGQRSKDTAEIHLVLVQRDGSDGESFLASGRRLTIGRRDGDVRFPEDEFLSPNHARVECSERSVRVIDLESHNGVYLRITNSEPVYPGDVFLLGHQLLRLDNVPESGRERPPAHGVRSFGTPLHPAWGRLVLIGYGGCEAET
ncbi:MAG: FHA domain-containing protein, partial [Nannocystaceae bacterium]